MLAMTGRKTLLVTVGKSGEVICSIGCYLESRRAPALACPPDVCVLFIQALRFTMDWAESSEPDLAIMGDKHSIDEDSLRARRSGWALRTHRPGVLLDQIGTRGQTGHGLLFPILEIRILLQGLNVLGPLGIHRSGLT